jgi:hypothetical protein
MSGQIGSYNVRIGVGKTSVLIYIIHTILMGGFFHEKHEVIGHLAEE